MSQERNPSQPRLPVVTARQTLRALERAGFLVDRVTGSHYILKHPRRPGFRVTLPMHRGDLKRRTLESIIEQAGLTAAEFQGLL